MLERYSAQFPQGTRAQINKAYRIDELTLMTELIEKAALSSEQIVAIRNAATHLVEQVRAERKKSTGIDSFLTQYSLTSDEGIALMCLAEALLRVPDNATIDSLIKDKLTTADWKSHRGQSDSFLLMQQPGL